MDITIDISQLNKEIGKLTNLEAGKPEGSKMLREMAQSVCQLMHIRIHREGLKSDGSRIGSYSPAYMKVRTGQYSTNEKFKKGKKQGETKPTGVFTKGKNKGKPRPRYNKTFDTKVILDLTGYMANDFAIGETNPIDLKDQGIGIGFTKPVEPGENITNNQKRLYLEERYGKIYDPTKEEIEAAKAIAYKYIANLLK